MSFIIPNHAAQTLAERCRRVRLDYGWKRQTLSARAGVPTSTIKRFENEYKISLDSFLRILQALGHLQDLAHILTPPEAQSIRELEEREKKELMHKQKGLKRRGRK